MFFVVTVTLGGRQRRPALQAWHQAPACALFAAPLVRADFGGQNTEVSPLPVLLSVVPLGLVSVAIDWQGLVAPFIVELFAFCRFDRNPREVFARFLGVATGKLPTPACVKRTSRALHPNGPNGFGPNPAGGFATILVRRSPALNLTDLPHHSGKRVPLALIHSKTSMG